ncbi:MAG TPA: tetratricopeptide repeat protein [Candidatus Polarisedimenticolia bacterium]|nr:tetratricopeptide repeat protein [Candidatus Polarisedimenticolia bacterium]
MGLSGFKEIVRDLTQSAEQRAISKALKLYAKGELAKAIEILKEAHEKSPENSDILFELARCQVLSDRATEAADALRTILRRSPRSFQKVSEMIEEIRARHVNVGPLFDAVAEHFIRHDDLKSAVEAMERMKPEEIRAFVPRHRGKWEGLKKNAPEARMAKASLLSAYYLALSHEVLREYDKAAEIYGSVARTNPEEMERLLRRFEALLAKDYQNSVLRVAVGELYLDTGHEEEGGKQLALALETDPRAAPTVAERVAAHLQEKGERIDLRWVLVQALLASQDNAGALEAMRPLVEAGALLDQVVMTLQPLAAADKSGPARRLLAAALARRGQAQSALDTLLQIAEDEGIKVIREPLEALVAAHPAFPRAHHILADIHLAEGRAAEAVQCMRQARDLAPGEESLLVPKLTRLLEADPAAADAHLLLADLLIKSGEMERGVVVLRHLVRFAPASSGEALARFAGVLKGEAGVARARLGAAEACLELKRFPEAQQHLAALAASNPELAAEFLHVVGLLSEAAPDLHAANVEMLRALEPKCPVPHAVHFALAEAAFHGGDFAAAATAFREVLDAVPERTEEVRSALERFDRDDPSGAEARYLLASLYLDRRDHAAALAELGRGGAVNGALLSRVLTKYEQILSASPDDLEARVGFVQALVLGRQFDRVLSVGQETLKLKDDQSTARIALAMGDALREKGDSDSAVKRYFSVYGRDRSLGREVVDRLKRLIDAEGTHPLASLALGKVLGSEGRGAEAVEALRAAAASDPKLADTVLNELQGLIASCPADPQPGLATLALLLERRNTKEAIQLVSSLLDAHPGLASDLAGHLERILALEPNQPFAVYESGRALQLLQAYPRSAAQYVAAFRLDNSLAAMILKRLQEIIVAAPTCPDPYLSACAIHAARGKFLAAAEKIQQAFEKIPTETERLLPRLEEIWKQHRGNSRLTLLFADACLKAGKHQKALAAFTEAAQKDATAADAAFTGLEAIVKACPKMGEAYLARARAHARKMRTDKALADLDRASRLEAHLLPEITEETEALRARVPDSYPGAILLADLYMAAGRDTEASRLLQAEMEKGCGKNERLSMLVRLWRIAAGRHDDESARTWMTEASRLATDRNQFFARVHEVYVGQLRAEAARMRDRLEQGSKRGADLETLLRDLIELGEVEEARVALEKHHGALDAPQTARLRAEIALRRGDYPRAAEQLRALGASKALAFGAARAGDYALAARTLEALATKSDDATLTTALHKVYRDLVARDLMGGRVRLQAETTLTFEPGAAR